MSNFILWADGIADMSFRWEEDLRQSFRENVTTEDWSGARQPRGFRSVIESRCSDGRADLVFASVFSAVDPSIRHTAQLLERPACSRILAAFESRRVQHVDALEKSSGVGSKSFR